LSLRTIDKLAAPHGRHARACPEHLPAFEISSYFSILRGDVVDPRDKPEDDGELKGRDGAARADALVNGLEHLCRRSDPLYAFEFNGFARGYGAGKQL
jgi:hypothetical protein